MKQWDWLNEGAFTISSRSGSVSRILKCKLSFSAFYCNCCVKTCSTDHSSGLCWDFQSSPLNPSIERITWLLLLFLTTWLFLWHMLFSTFSASSISCYSQQKSLQRPHFFAPFYHLLVLFKENWQDFLLSFAWPPQPITYIPLLPSLSSPATLHASLKRTGPQVQLSGLFSREKIY